MAKAIDLVAVLKRELKVQGMTYAQLAARLELSEGAIKRMFSLGRMTLERMDEICGILGIQLSDLVHLHAQNEHRINRLTEQQEAEIVGDVRRLIVAVLVINNWTFEELTDRLDMQATECVRHLAHLDRFGLIELLPGNRVRLRFDQDFRWIPGGPIESFFQEHVVDEFLKADFNQPDRSQRFIHGFLSKRSVEHVKQRIDEFAAEVNELLRADSKLPANRRAHAGVLLAFRPWRFSAFEEVIQNKE